MTDPLRHVREAAVAQRGQGRARDGHRLGRRAAVDVVAAALDGIEAGAHEILADDVTVGLKAQMHLDPAARYGASITG